MTENIVYKSWPALQGSLSVLYALPVAVRMIQLLFLHTIWHLDLVHVHTKSHQNILTETKVRVRKLKGSKRFAQQRQINRNV